MIATLGGAGRVAYAGGDLIAGMGSLVLIAPGTRHDYGTEPAAGRWDLLWAHFLPRAHWLEWLGWPPVSSGIMTLDLRDPVAWKRIVRSLMRMHRAATGAHALKSDFAMNALEQALLWCKAQAPLLTRPVDPRIEEAMDYICHNLQSPLGAAELAARAQLSVSRFMHLFRQEAGSTSQQFIEQQRMERARQLLELSGLSVGEIATEVGYESAFYFSNRFKRRTGLAPYPYRLRALCSGDETPRAT